ncbi:hypothetical protein [Metapseudomonas otitidis]|uniref:hypothetical protein n=1 Tax=Metapseudomonas otitidis TaxID=319939 RepID=UPI002447DA2F|nr:hypothetical protein [Pseudomonas otitidis]MDG9785383.1 hypothetical protein [Pseudomonas otitidis]
MSKFKPGDLALIVNCYEPENIGKCVELVELVPNGCTYESGEFEVTNGSGMSLWHVAGDIRTVFDDGDVMVGHAQKAECNLMPLRGDFQPEQEKAKEVEA